jgi:hypothetical protein
MKMNQTQRIIWYDNPLIYQRLWTDGADLCPYGEFLTAFDNLVAACLARKQSFEKVYVDPLVMHQWLRDHGLKNNNAGRATFSCLMYLPKHHERGDMQWPSMTMMMLLRTA